ncbi:MAG: hypothetical protein IPM51_05225 [Sphingobacteriaceae bacterium]|nr:hypothetical protein [Sphingobacteriaceae bacterium]
MIEKKVHITFDYELFFGDSTGSVQNCILNPTNKLIELARNKKVNFIFFVDAGYLYKLNQFSNYPKAEADLKLITEQLRLLVLEGHEIGLHVHPHWEDCIYDGDKWEMSIKRYKLSDFSLPEATAIINKYNQFLELVAQVKVKSFRAGGWCIQPFSFFKEALIANQIYIDSSVFYNGFHQYTAHAYDFRNAPAISEWNFNDNECKPEKNGIFTEMAITSDRIHPFFYISLYLKMKMNPLRFKPEGDGMWLKDKGKIYRQFYSYTNHFACSDGFFASRLKSILDQVLNKNLNRMVVLGHPKSLAQCSYSYLADFIDYANEKNYKISVF